MRVHAVASHASPYNLWQIERIITDGVEDQVLEFVDYVEEILTESGHVGCMPRNVGFTVGLGTTLSCFLPGLLIESGTEL